MGNKINYSEVARKSGLSVSFISRIMRRERDPSLHSFIQIAKAMGVDPNKMIKILKGRK